MSINLECDQFNLYQTPTEVTYKCYYAGSPFVIDNWENIRDKYIKWLRATNKHDKDYAEMAEDHIKDLMSYPHLTFRMG